MLAFASTFATTMTFAFQDFIETWYMREKRDLPWRKTQDPYLIWLSEIILQQTRIDQGTAYFLRFVTNFPTVQKLASATEQEVLLLWQGLGYYSRARNLHKTAKLVASDYNGIFPSSYDALLNLPGIGPYTAAAIASIAFNKPHAVVDGNVFRVLSRVFGIATPIDSPAGKKGFEALANQLIQGRDPGLFNQAVMEFGALHCKPANPLCDSCALSSTCIAFQNNTVKMLPIKTGKRKVRIRYFDYFIPVFPNSGLIIEKRNSGDIWENLWQFPLVAADAPEIGTTPPPYLSETSWSLIAPQQIHKLTHQHLYTRFYIGWGKHLKSVPEHFELVPLNQIEQYPFPILLQKLLPLIADFAKSTQAP
jgi:A/G-specific adenine glycosylase